MQAEIVGSTTQKQDKKRFNFLIDIDLRWFFCYNILRKRGIDK